MNLKTIKSSLLYFIIIGILLSHTGLADTAKNNRESQLSISFDVGKFYPQSSWKNHPYAGVEQFSGGISFGGDAELRLATNWSLAFNFAFQSLDVSHWEQYARSQGDTVKASASMFYFGGLIKGYFVNGRYFSAKIGVGAGYFFPSGKENHNGLSYDYDFLESGICGLAQMDLNQYFINNFALMFKLTYLLSFSGMEYADGSDTSAIQGFSITGGIRVDL